jgi:H+/Cl- antiporter ClcA
MRQQHDVIEFEQARVDFCAVLVDVEARAREIARPQHARQRVLVEPLAAGSGIPETMSSLNGTLHVYILVKCLLVSRVILPLNLQTHYSVVVSPFDTCLFLSFFLGLVLPKAFTGKVLTCKFFSCLLAVGSGLPAGPEGPMIHMGGILGVIISQGRVRRLIRCTPRPLRQWLEGAVLTFRNARDRRDFMAAGVAGGVAAAFGAPVGGLLFVAEELATHWDVGLGMQVK